jgi:chloramphenicol-sensitive protein RarD
LLLKSDLGFGRLKYFLAAIGSAFIWGFVSISVRNLQGYQPEQILYYRIFTSLIVTWLVILFFRRDKIRSDILFLRRETIKYRRKLFWLTIVASILITGNWFFYIYVVNTVSLKAAAFAYMVCPLITAFGGYFIFKEHLSKLKFLAIGIALISILILAQGSLTEVMWSVFIALLYGFYILSQNFDSRIDKFNMLAVQFLVSSLLTFPIFIYQKVGFPINLPFWINTIIIAVLFTIIPLFLSLYSLKGIPSSSAGIIIYITPIVAFAIAFLYFHEHINMHQVIAYALLLIAVVIFNGEIINQVIFKKNNRI